MCHNTLTHKLINVCNTLHNAENTHTHTVHMNICMYIKNSMCIHIHISIRIGYAYKYICMPLNIDYPSDLGNFARLAGQIRV